MMKYFDLSADLPTVAPSASPVPNGGTLHLSAPTPWPVGAGLAKGDNLAEVLDGINWYVATAASRERDHTRHLSTGYFQTAMYWRGLGFNVIPGTIDKKPLVTFMDLSGENPKELTARQVILWAREFPDATPLLLPDSGRFFRMTVVDADSPTMFAWVEAEYGTTPFCVTTGRDGGGKHYYYLTPKGLHVGGRNKIIGPDDGVLSWDHAITGGKIVKHKHWGKTAIDVKSYRNYVVAPGAVHKSGRHYLPAVALDGLTVDWFMSHVPVFDAALYGRHLAESAARKATKDKAIRDTLPPSHLQTVAASRANCGSIPVTFATTEPFLAWCESDPEALNLHTWWGLASNLAAAYGEGGRVEFHSVSALSEKYKAAEADRTYTKAMAGLGPASYQALGNAGYYGPIPEGYKSPAAFLLGHSNAVSVSSIDIDVLADELLAPYLSDDLAELVESTMDGVVPERIGSDKATRTPELIDYAQHALQVATGWEWQFRERWAAAGVKPPSGRGCARVHQLLDDGHGNLIVASRPCNRMACLYCGPRLLSRKLASLLVMPLTPPGYGDERPDDWHGPDRPLGCPMGARTTYWATIPAAQFASWTRQFHRASGKNSIPRADLQNTVRLEYKRDIENYHTQVGQCSITHGYVAFHSGTKVMLVSTLKVTTTDRKVRGVMVPGMSPTYLDVPPSNLGDLLHRMADQTYELEIDDIAGEVTVAGRVTTSENLDADPDKLRRLAYPNDFRLKGPSLPPGEARHVLDGLRVPHLYRSAVTPDDPEERPTQAGIRIRGIDAVRAEEIAKALKPDRQPTPVVSFPMDLTDCEELVNQIFNEV